MTVSREPRTAGPEDRELVLSHLRRTPLRYGWVIQDLTMWPDDSTFVYGEPVDDELDFVHVSGHPATQRQRTVVLGGDPTRVAALLGHFPKEPWLVRETAASLLAPVLKVAPEAKVFHEQRLEVTRATFLPQHRGDARRLDEKDAAALAGFFDRPQNPGDAHWLRGAVVYGLFKGAELVSIGSTLARIDEGWELGSIETKAAWRGKGCATEVTSALTAAGLEEAPAVSLTVVTTNEAAQKLYRKLGYAFREDRIWVDNGTGATP